MFASLIYRAQCFPKSVLCIMCSTVLLLYLDFSRIRGVFIVLLIASVFLPIYTTLFVYIHPESFTRTYDYHLALGLYFISTALITCHCLPSMTLSNPTLPLFQPSPLSPRAKFHAPVIQSFTPTPLN
jgi:hypothetical protein